MLNRSRRDRNNWRPGPMPLSCSNYLKLEDISKCVMLRKQKQTFRPAFAMSTYSGSKIQLHDPPPFRVSRVHGLHCTEPTLVPTVFVSLNDSGSRRSSSSDNGDSNIVTMT